MAPTFLELRRPQTSGGLGQRLAIRKPAVDGGYYPVIVA